MSKESDKCKMISFRGELLHKPVNRDQIYCHHPELVVDGEFRLLHCNTCGLWIEPFDFLQKWAAKGWVARSRTKQWEEKTDSLVKRVHELKEEERRLKARISRAKKKLEGLT